MKIKSVKFIKSVVHPKDHPGGNYPEIAFSGRSNVGKSSLINCLLQRRSIAKVSSTPGKTQHINFFLINDSFYFVDLPGYGYAKVPMNIRKRWKFLVQGYLETSKKLKGIVQLIDSRHPPTKQDLEIIKWLVIHEIPAIIILTKIDKLKRTQRNKNIKLISSELGIVDEDAILPFSIKTGEGREALLQLLSETL